MKKIKAPYFIVFLMCYKMSGQLNNLNIEEVSNINFKYEMTPNFDDVQLQTTAIGATYKDSTTIGTFSYGVNYSNYNYTFKDLGSLDHFTDGFNKLNYVAFKLQHNIELKNNWSSSITFEPNVFSNFESALSINDVNLSGGVLLSKKWINSVSNEKELQLGIGYSALFGKPQLFPVFNYYYEVSDKFFLSLGFPKTSFKYKVDSKSQFTLSLFKDGFHTSDITLKDANNLYNYQNLELSYDAIKVNLNYGFQLGKEFEGFLNLGFLPEANLKLSTGEEFSEFKTNQTIFFGCGIKYNININKL